MKKVRVRELPDWPPQPGGANPGAYKVPASEQAIVRRVESRHRAKQVTFVGEFEGHGHTYDYEASSEKLAAAMRNLVGNNLGKSVFALGDLEIETE